MTEEDEPKPTTKFLRNRDKWIREIVNDPRLPHPTARVAVHLAMRLNGEDRVAWPSTSKIAAMTGVGVRSVLRALDDLEGIDRKTGHFTETRYLTITRKRNSGNKYQLHFFWL